MDKKEMIIVLDFGGQYNQLIARRVRECNVYAEVWPYTKSLEEIKAANPAGIIFTGGPNSVYDEASPHYEKAIFDIGIPILGICYGSQLVAYTLGGEVKTAPVSEYGHTDIQITEKPDKDKKLSIFDGVPQNLSVWMSHTDYIAKVPEGFVVTAHSKDCPVAAMECEEKKFYATQFHPEVMHTEFGEKMIYNFVRNICGCSGNWRMDSFVQSKIEEIREKVGDGKVLLALSGGVDSSVAAVLLSKAVGKQLTCVFVDQGLLRKNEGDEVEAIFGPKGNYDLNFVRVNAQERFYKKLEGVTEPEKKRKIIGEEFIRVFEEESKKIGKVDFLAQGTIYPDVIESGLGKSAVIKSHHNVGGLPDYVDFREIIEPLRMLFKDEVRKAGLELGLPEELVFRQPFPGPGLGVRIIGEVNEEKVRIVQDADYIFREEIRIAVKRRKEELLAEAKEFEAKGDTAKADSLKKQAKENPTWLPNQYFAALSNMRSVGVMGDFRTYDYAVVLRAVNTSDFMTAECTNIPFETLQKAMNRIINEVKSVNRVMYDLTSKPPGTIELE